LAIFGNMYEKRLKNVLYCSYNLNWYNSDNKQVIGITAITTNDTIFALSHCVGTSTKK